MEEFDPAPRISLVIPNLNSGRTLERCIRSLLDQEYPNLEVIVADGGSVDESVEVLRAYEHCVAKVLREPDSGQADALNRGFRHATGEIFGWLCADDELTAGALRHVGGLFALHPEAHVVAGACERVFDGGFTVRNPVRPDAWDAIGVRNTLDQPSVFWRSEWWRRAGELDASFDLAFDWEYWRRLQRAGARLMTTARVLSRYHFSAANKTSTGGRRHVEEGYRIVRRHGPAFLARAFRFVYRHFDLHGCLDRPPAASPGRRFAYLASRRILRAALGPAMDDYPWHFASLQERGLRWYEEYQPAGAGVTKETARVTIVTPSLNGGRWLRATIESILSQDYPDLEYLIVDGGSTDETASIVNEYAGRLTFVVDKDRGRSNAINKGIRRAGGDFVAWLNCGDILLPGAVHRAVAELAAVPEAAAVYGAGYLLGRGNPATFPKHILPAAVLFRKRIFAETGYLDEDLQTVSDWDLLIRIAKRHELACLPEFQAYSPVAGEERIGEIARLIRRHTGKRLSLRAIGGM